MLEHNLDLKLPKDFPYVALIYLRKFNENNCVESLLCYKRENN